MLGGNTAPLFFSCIGAPRVNFTVTVPLFSVIVDFFSVIIFTFV